MFVSILENGRHLGFLIGPSGRIDLVTIEMPYANFGACITICTINLKNACYLLHYRRWLYGQRSELGRSLKHAMICSRLGTRTHVRQLLENAVPGPGLCLGLSNVVFVREASV